ncbi:MAG: hypothetical protein V3S51_02025 [Dehalococcoidia bacterium]
MSLPDTALARRTDPDTSHEAARKAKAAKMELRVLQVLSIYIKGLTSKEVAVIGDFELNSTTPRFRPLTSKGFIYDTGERRLNPGSQRKAIVWKLTTRGIYFLINLS